MIVILVGLPASGKGTQAKLLSTDENLRFEHVAVGDLLRLKGKEKPEVGELLKTGNLLPELEVNSIVLSAIDDIDKNYLLDGYPRSLGQYQFLVENIKTQFRAVQLEIPKEALLSRIQGRYSCACCFAVFNDVDCTQESKVCDFCSSKSFLRRSDDCQEALRRRIEEYKLHTEPVLEELSKAGVLTKFDATLNPLEIFKQIKAKILEWSEELGANS